MISLSNINIHILGRISAFPSALVYHYNPESKKYVIGTASNFKAVRISQTSILKLIIFLSSSFLRNCCKDLKPSDQQEVCQETHYSCKDHLKQKQYSKTASRSRPSSAKSTSSSVSHFSRSPSDRVKSDDWRFAECCKFQDIKWLTSICTGEKNFQTCMGI